jgi:hypothetical protein
MIVTMMHALRRRGLGHDRLSGPAEMNEIV